MTPGRDTSLCRLTRRTAVYGPVRAVVWAFYYPQLRPLSLPFLEDGDVGRDDFLHKGSCPSVIGGQALHFREPVSRDIDDLRLLSAIFVGQPVGLGPGLCFTNTV